MIKSLAHVCFVVADLDASVAFYRDVLGLKPAFDFINDQGHRFGVYVHVSGRSFIELFECEPGQTGPWQSYQHLCLEVDDIEAAAATLRERGVDVTPVTMGSDHSWQAWLVDPDGNRIELHAYTPESQQAPFLA